MKYLILTEFLLNIILCGHHCLEQNDPSNMVNVNLLAPGRCGSNFKSINFKLIM